MNCLKNVFSWFLFFSLFINFSACSLQYQRTVQPEKKYPQIIFEDLDLTQYKKNKKDVELKSVRFEQFKDSSVSFAKDSTFIIYDSAQNPTSTGRVALISADTKKEIFTLYDGIEFLDKSQDIKISADSLKWNGKSEQIVSERNNQVTIKKGDLTITGKDFSASAVSNKFLFSEKVQGEQILVNKKTGEKDTVIFSGDSMQGSVSSKSTDSKNSVEFVRPSLESDSGFFDSTLASNNSSNSTILSGNAFVKTSSMTINADSIELCGDDFNFIKAKGAVKGTNSESELEFSADSLEYNQDTKLVVLSGNVELKDTKNDVTAKAQVIEYDQNSDVAVMQLDVELKQKQNVCTGAYSVYRKKEQVLELSGNACVKQAEDVFRAQSIRFNMDTEEIVMDGNIRGNVTTKSE